MSSFTVSFANGKIPRRLLRPLNRWARKLGQDPFKPEFEPYIDRLSVLHFECHKRVLFCELKGLSVRTSLTKQDITVHGDHFKLEMIRRLSIEYVNPAEKECISIQITQLGDSCKYEVTVNEEGP